MKPRSAFPHPYLSLLLAASWIALQQSLALPQLITAGVLGWGLPRLLHGFLEPGARLRSGLKAVRFTLVVLYDIVVANFTVARIVLSPWSRPQPGWVVVPLDLRHPTGIVLLATVITTTPGTVSCIVDEAGRRILVHALDCPDAPGMAQEMKARYERPLMEMFE